MPSDSWALGKTAIGHPGGGFRVGNRTFWQSGVLAGPKQSDLSHFAFYKQELVHVSVEETAQGTVGFRPLVPDTPA